MLTLSIEFHYISLAGSLGTMSSFLPEAIRFDHILVFDDDQLHLPNLNLWVLTHTSADPWQNRQLSNGSQKDREQEETREEKKGPVCNTCGPNGHCLLSPLQQVNNGFVGGVRRRHNNCIIVLDLTLCIRRRARMHFSGRGNHRWQGKSFLFLAHITYFMHWHFYENSKAEEKGKERCSFEIHKTIRFMSIDRPSISKYESASLE